jgi:hypothetical protein
MSPTRANLMTIVQCRPLWFWHFWGAMISLAALVAPFSESAQPGATLTLLVFPMWTGVITASLAKDFFTKPFAFVIPRHEHLWRRTLFTVALIVAAMCALDYTLVALSSPEVLATRVWGVFFLSVAVFTSGALFATASPNSGFVPAIITLLLVIGFNDKLGVGLREPVERTLLGSPAITAAACTAVAAAAWWTFGSRSLSRRLCGDPFMPLHGALSGQRQATFNAERKALLLRRSPGVFMNWTGRFVLSRMRSLAGHTTLKTLWGTFYMQVGRSAPARAANFIALAVLLAGLTLLLGFYHPHRLSTGVSGANLVLFLTCIIGGEYRINPHASLLLNVSRKARFRSMLFSAVLHWLFLAAVGAALTAISIFAGRYLGELTISGVSYAYVPVVPQSFLVFAPMLPFFFWSQLMFPKHHVIAMMVVAAVSVPLFFAGGYKLLDSPVTGLLLLQAICWLPFVGFVHHYCYRQDLQLNGQ